MNNETEILERARQVFDIEIEGLQSLRQQLGKEFLSVTEACMQTLNRGGKLILTGIGKSGHIAHKMAATLSSTGSVAVFLHPVEAMHGDLGIVTEKDLVMAISYSGETDELLRMLPSIRRLGAPIVAVTGNLQSRLAQIAQMVLPMPIPREACPFGMAPTTSTTALLALGDALAMVLLQCRNFTVKDFALRHPAGAIGRAISLRVKDLMRTGERLPMVSPAASVKEGLLCMTAARAGAVAIVDEQQNLLGVFTDGDFRRRIVADSQLLQKEISTVMTPSPITVQEESMAVDLLKLLESRKIDDILAVDANGKLVGLIDIQDLPKFKVM